MKVLVPIKRVIDPYVKIRVKSDFTAVETSNVKMAMNPFDEIAIEQALRWKEAGLITEVMVVSIGLNECQETLRQGLALGADVARHVLCSHTLEPILVAQTLAAIVKEYDPKIVIMGKQAIDDDCNQTGQMLAGILNWPQVTFVSELEFVNDNKALKAMREVDNGLEILETDLPVVITTDLRLNEPRYATLPNIMQAKRKPLTVTEWESLGLPYAVHTEVLKVTPPPARKTGKKVADVAELIHYLHDIEKVI